MPADNMKSRVAVKVAILLSLFDYKAFRIFRVYPIRPIPPKGGIAFRRTPVKRNVTD